MTDKQKSFLSKRKRSNKNTHYIDNKKFSKAVFEYVTEVARTKKEIEEAEKSRRNYIPEIPVVPDYIAQSFMDLADNLGNSPSFSGYSYLDEMKLDAIENCLKAINNFNVDADTKDGAPNAFSYFTTISYYAFVRRIKKEARQKEIRDKFVLNATPDSLTDMDMSDKMQTSIVMNYMDGLRSKYDDTKEMITEDDLIKEEKTSVLKKKKVHLSDSNLEEFM